MHTHTHVCAGVSCVCVFSAGIKLSAGGVELSKVVLCGWIDVDLFVEHFLPTTSNKAVMIVVCVHPFVCGMLHVGTTWYMLTAVDCLVYNNTYRICLSPTINQRNKLSVLHHWSCLF